jgi:hypothetical protein
VATSAKLLVLIDFSNLYALLSGENRPIAYLSNSIAQLSNSIAQLSNSIAQLSNRVAHVSNSVVDVKKRPTAPLPRRDFRDVSSVDSLPGRKLRVKRFALVATLNS